MKQTTARWQLAGFVFTSIVGTFLHFLYDITGENPVAGVFSAVNESIWEHMKLLYYPMMLFSVAEYRRWGREQPGFWCSKLAGMTVGLGLIPVLYYTYTGILGVSADWFNITIFFLAALIAYRVETWLLHRGTCRIPKGWAIALLVAIGLIFTLLTFFPPRIPFFQDPVTGTYGIRRG